MRFARQVGSRRLAKEPGHQDDNDDDDDGDDDDGDDDDGDDDDCPPGHRGATHAWVEDRSPWVREVLVPGPLAVQRNIALRSLCSCRPPASCPARSV